MAKAYDGSKPSVGRIVHFYSETADEGLNKIPHAAIITYVYDNPDLYVGLTVFARGIKEYDVRVSAPFSEEPKPGHWTWPPRA